MRKQLFMRNEVLESGAPLPLAELLQQHDGVSVEDQRIKAFPVTLDSYDTAGA